MMLIRRLILLTGTLAASTLVQAGYSNASHSAEPVSTQVSEPATATAPKTTTTTLPAKTNNAWEVSKIKLKGLDGDTHVLRDWSGKVIVFNFWASWCGPCQYEIRDLVELQKKYGPQGLQVVGLGVDEERKLRNVQRTLEINYPVLFSDPAQSARLLTDWGNEKQVIPYNVLINRDGKIVYIHRGQLDEAAFNDFVLPLLKK